MLKDLKKQNTMLSKEIQEHMRNKVIDMYKSGKGYKAISKASGLQQTKVRVNLEQLWT